MSLDAINWVAKQKAGNATAKHVLLWLAFHSNGKSGKCFPSLDTLAEEMEVGSKNTIRAALKTLFDRKLISCEREMKGARVARTFYRLNFDGSNSDISNIEHDGSNSEPYGSNIELSMVQKLTPNKEIEQGINRERNKESSMRTSGAPYPEDFDKSLFDEAEREARSFPEPLPEPPAQPPVEQPASTPARPKMAYPPCQYEKVVELYHANCRGLRRVLALTDARKRTINARWREFCKEDDLKTTAEALESFEWYFQEVSKSRFLMGYSTPGPGRDRPFKADFDWLMCPTNFLKVCEGKYSNGPKN